MTAEKRKRVSKKRKIAWRKHSKVKDVEQFLEEQAFEDRIGKSIELKSDKELFHLDTKPAESVTLTKKEKRKLLLEKPLKSFSHFQQPIYLPTRRDARKDIISKRLQRKLSLKAKEKMKPTEIQSLKDRKAFKQNKKLLSIKEKYDNDVWITENLTNLKNDTLQSEWISNSTRQNILRGESKFQKTLPKVTRWKQTIIPSIEPPHPGTSYNPSLQDHQALLQEIAEKEQKIIKDEEHLNRVTSKMFRKITPQEKESDWLKEMSQGLPHDQNGSLSDEEVADTGDRISINPPVINKKKDLKTRRKQREQQKLKHTLNIAKKEKRKIADIYKLRQIKTKLDKRDKQLEKLKTIKESKRKELISKPKRVGSRKYEEPDLEFNNIKDITGSLRTLKREGNLLRDRLKSLQKRNIVEPTARHNKKKAKLKKFVKPGHKEDWKTTVARATPKKKVLLVNKKKKDTKVSKRN